MSSATETPEVGTTRRDGPHSEARGPHMTHARRPRPSADHLLPGYRVYAVVIETEDGEPVVVGGAAASARYDRPGPAAVVCDDLAAAPWETAVPEATHLIVLDHAGVEHHRRPVVGVTV